VWTILNQSLWNNQRGAAELFSSGSYAPFVHRPAETDRESARSSSFDLVVWVRKGGSRNPISQFPNQRKLASIARGRSKRRSAMTGKVIVSEFVLPTALAIVLGVLLSVGAICSTIC
jgi:hypothetical protein